MKDSKYTHWEYFNFFLLSSYFQVKYAWKEKKLHFFLGLYVLWILDIIAYTIYQKLN